MDRPNPYAPATPLDEPDPFSRGDDAERIRGGFLHRELRIFAPVEVTMCYDGRWFRQKVQVDGQVVWFRISWLRIHRRLTFDLPPEVDPEQRVARIDIGFTPALWIRRFRLWIDDSLVYDEVW